MVGPVLSASRSWDNGACTQPPAELPASATMGIGKDSISRLPYFAFFLFSFTVGDADRLLCYFLISSFAVWEIFISSLHFTLSILVAKVPNTAAFIFT